MTPTKWWHYVLLAIIVSGLSILALVAIAAAIIYPSLPSLDALTNYQPKLPLRVYSEDGYLIGEFGEERRAFIDISQVPQNLKDAVLAIEDRRFYQHGGIDTTGVLRAIKNNVTGKSHEGASTITMQVAKNFFTPPNGKRTFITKINESLLAIKIERTLTKDKILELYINQIYLGQRSYGFAAASQIYYGKTLDKLNLAETALLAGLPKAPSGYNPFINPKRAIGRQQEVLRDMYRFGFLKENEYQAALKQPLRFKEVKRSRDLSADYVAEIVRETLYAQYQDEIYSSGLNVFTTIRRSNQEAANNAVREGILNYDLRHGYRGPEAMLDLGSLQSDDDTASNNKNPLDNALDEFETFNGFIPAIITNATPKSIQAHTKYGDDIVITGKGLSFVEKMLAEKDPAKHLLKAGAVIRVLKTKDEKSADAWRIVQLPQVESALVALDPENGAVRALVGGFDFNRSKFNHITQAWRQPGSSFKPFIYSAALEKGYTPASILEDSPLTFSASETGNKAWSPKNYEDGFGGPIRLRQALTKSVNMVAIRVLNDIDPIYAQSYITRFGFAAKDHPPYLTMALGAGSATPWQMASAYAVFANGGYRVKPNLIAKIVDHNGKVIMTTKFDHAGNGAPRVIDARNAFIMNSMMQSVVRNGTATKALKLGRSDIAGKTGTTNDHIDAWFAGYSPKQVAIAWIGFDKPRSLGKGETGGGAALPIWIKYMETALKGVPEVQMRIPDGVIAINIDPSTGTRDEGGIMEYFYHENPPPLVESALPPLLEDGDESGFNPAAPSQPQRLLQPEIILPSSPPGKHSQTVPNQPPNTDHTDAQGHATKLLNSN
ncbi:MAG: penicillin-binding protein 1A [Methylotenera sp.]|uniref:penicillin-binding protein 1A n=2 Tax=Methylotenera sp. TaxID=2051956 RepID=UPI0027268EA8|nr:penicillin-binding protein 1A [Methylotenera sp.]MDO9393732.1 penicillin-binding protein 1A [Methylotenera sp.]MDP1523446.1 penicillin-binding protein 1A [Methylotenera sp.]